MFLNEDNLNIIGDIGGLEQARKDLIKKMPKARNVYLGDPNDRGLETKQVIESIMKDKESILIHSNHAHIMIETYNHSKYPFEKPRYYQKDLWFHNGGQATLFSYDKDWDKKIKYQKIQVGDSDYYYLFEEAELHHLIDSSHIEFLEKSPMFLETNRFVLTHAPIIHNRTIEESCNLGPGFFSKIEQISDSSVLWNRFPPKRENKFFKKINIFGHNTYSSVKIFSTKYPNGISVDEKNFNEVYLDQSIYSKVFAISLDTKKYLSGLNTETMTLFQVEKL